MTRHSPHLLTALHIARSTARLAWLGGTVALVALIALPHVLPVFGRQMYVVRGASMEPTIPIGSVVFVHKVDPALVQVGQIVTYQLPQGTVVTHRVVARDTADGTFETKGDANPTPDAGPVPGAEIVGGVELAVPDLGNLIVSLSSTAGEVMLIFALGGLLLAGWFFDELLATLRRQAPSGTVARAIN